MISLLALIFIPRCGQSRPPERPAMRESPLMKIWISFRFKNFWVSMRRSQSARANQEVGKGIAICPSLITTMTTQLQIDAGAGPGFGCSFSQAITGYINHRKKMTCQKLALFRNPTHRKTASPELALVRNLAHPKSAVPQICFVSQSTRGPGHTVSKLALFRKTKRPHQLPIPAEIQLSEIK